MQKIESRNRRALIKILKLGGLLGLGGVVFEREYSLMQLSLGY